MISPPSVAIETKKPPLSSTEFHQPGLAASPSHESKRLSIAGSRSVPSVVSVGWLDDDDDSSQPPSPLRYGSYRGSDDSDEAAGDLSDAYVSPASTGLSPRGENGRSASFLGLDKLNTSTQPPYRASLDESDLRLEVSRLPIYQGGGGGEHGNWRNPYPRCLGYILTAQQVDSAERRCRCFSGSHHARYGEG